MKENRILIAGLVWLVATVSSVTVPGKAIGGPDQSSFAFPTAGSVASIADFPDAMRWEPSWRRPADCGPLNLYLLMKLFDKQVTLEEVRRSVKVDPVRGCSLADLKRAATQLGLATEVRFVKAHDLWSLPGPFILHGIKSIEKHIGHYTLIIGPCRDKNAFRGIDLRTEKLILFAEDVVLSSFSGYVLIPKQSIIPRLEYWTSYALIFAGLANLLVELRDLFWRQESRKSPKVKNVDVACETG